MNKDELRIRFLKFIDAAELCLSKEYVQPCLMILYSTIDNLAYLNRKENHAGVIQEDFKNWTEEYLQPKMHSALTADDLYGARCGVLHAGSSESNKSRRGEANEIFYTWGTHNEDVIQGLLEKAQKRNPKLERNVRIMNIDKVLAALKLAIEHFCENRGAEKLIIDRATKIFVKGKLPQNFVKSRFPDIGL
jgi:hypothetical protein